MHKSITPLDGLIEEHRLLLAAVFQDGRSLYSNRKSYDIDYKRVTSATYGQLYSWYKELTRSLVAGQITTPLFADTSSPFGIRWTRQVLGLFSRLDSDSVEEHNLIGDWITRVTQIRSSMPTGDLAFARSLVKRLLGPAPQLCDLIPRHGPGAVSTGEKGAEKRHFTHMYRQLLSHGGVDLLHLNENHWRHEPHLLELFEHPTTRVVCVPKDLYKKRVISCEPLTLQFLQQGVARYLMAKLEANRYAQIRFTDQSWNRTLTNLHLSMATLDMSNASDTVSRRIVSQLFPADWKRLLFSLRSHFAVTPDGVHHPLRCFAPMGSALCFPVEAIVFYTVVCSALHRAGASLHTRQQTVVYGDDIIVARPYARYVMRYLCECGFYPNFDKCCIDTPFRESCGEERWNGDSITIQRPRHITLRKGVHSLPMVGMANRLLHSGFWNAACFIAENYPNIVALGCGEDLGDRRLPWKHVGHTRWNRDLQRLEQAGDIAVQAMPSRVQLDGYASLFMGMCSGWSSEHVLSRHQKMKRQWISVDPLGRS